MFNRSFLTQIDHSLAQMRAAVISINLYAIDCDGGQLANDFALASITRNGGPILYLNLYSFALIVIIGWVDSRSLAPWNMWKTRRSQPDAVDINLERFQEDVTAEAKLASLSLDLLRVLDVSKTYDDKKVVDNMTFGVSRDTVFVMLGPNGRENNNARYNLYVAHHVPRHMTNNDCNLHRWLRCTQLWRCHHQWGIHPPSKEDCSPISWRLPRVYHCRPPAHRKGASFSLWAIKGTRLRRRAASPCGHVATRNGFGSICRPPGQAIIWWKSKEASRLPYRS
jgi:hypothetical protein